ncbi:MAG: Kdo hydroxylase family protein, partial [Rhodoferax sp.]
WVCFSDQASHAVMSGQYMLEQTLFLAPEHLYDPQASPLAILSRLTGRPLVAQRAK